MNIRTGAFFREYWVSLLCLFLSVVSISATLTGHSPDFLRTVLNVRNEESSPQGHCSADFGTYLPTEGDVMAGSAPLMPAIVERRISVVHVIPGRGACDLTASVIGAYVRRLNPSNSMLVIVGGRASSTHEVQSSIPSDLLVAESDTFYVEGSVYPMTSGVKLLVDAGTRKIESVSRIEWEE